MAASRARYLSIGALLASRGLTVEPDDVFYIYQDELVPALEQGIVPDQDELDRRRDFVAACRAASPPPRAGQGRHSRHARARSRALAPRRGRTRAARGSSIRSKTPALQPGEVLVTRATTPAWTPLFGVAGAVVTNAGGALSHTAIVAREFGIPAVLGTQNGTQHDTQTARWLQWTAPRAW